MSRSRAFGLGYTAHGGSAACCLMRGAAVVAVADEASFSRLPGDTNFPARAIRHVLAAAEIDADDVALTVVAGAGDHAPAIIQELRAVVGYHGACEVVDRATAHAACAFLFSPLAEAAVMTIDALVAANYFLGRGTEVTLLGGWSDPAGAVRLLDAGADELSLNGDRTFALLRGPAGGSGAWTGGPRGALRP